MSQVQTFLEKYFANDDGKFDPNDHIDKFAMIYLAIIFVTCIALRGMGII
ncbi:MAG: hypothetical protein A4E28_00221 [Methanocella sp. PtaU1.Bin125]|nr:MAG: hypothetical protein A4E28_00221 [Methanocella sp. PtaU1.Bin125]